MQLPIFLPGLLCEPPQRLYSPPICLPHFVALSLPYPACLKVFSSPFPLPMLGRWGRGFNKTFPLRGVWIAVIISSDPCTHGGSSRLQNCFRLATKGRSRSWSGASSCEQVCCLPQAQKWLPNSFEDVYHVCRLEKLGL